MNTKIKELKAELKDLAIKINAGKIKLKEYQRAHGGNHGIDGCALLKTQIEYRHKHIAYCILRGRTIDQIENKNREGNEPNQDLINEYWEYAYEEAICVNQT